MPKITVAIPAYNNEKYIEETLNSLKNQTLEDFEVIIVNDGSTDSTQDIIDRFCKDKRFISVIQNNSGVSAARNAAVKIASGEYICFLDADDLYSPESLEGFYSKAKATNADLVIGRIKRFDTNGEYVNNYAEKLSTMDEIDNFDTTLLWNLLVSNKCYRLSKLREFNIEFPPVKYAEETPFFLEFIYHDVKISGTKNATMFYRKHENAVSQSVKPQLVRDYVFSIDLSLKLAENAGADEEYLQEIILKKAQILLSQFYRFFWRADDESLTEIQKGFSDAFKNLSEKNKNKIREMNFDLNLERLIFNRKQAAENPKISLILKDATTEKIDEIYCQLYPFFELFIPESAENCVSDKWKNAENLHIISNENFVKKAKKKSKSDIIVIDKNTKINDHIFRHFVRYKNKIKLPSQLLFTLLKIYLNR